MDSVWRRRDVAQLLSVGVTALGLSVLACSDATGPKTWRFSCLYQGSDTPEVFVVTETSIIYTANDALHSAQFECDAKHPATSITLPDGTKFTPSCKCTQI